MLLHKLFFSVLESLPSCSYTPIFWKDRIANTHCIEKTSVLQRPHLPIGADSYRNGWVSHLKDSLYGINGSLASTTTYISKIIRLEVECKPINRPHRKGAPRYQDKIRHSICTLLSPLGTLQFLVHLLF